MIKKGTIFILLYLIVITPANSQSYWAKSYDGGYDEKACCADVIGDGLIVAANMKQIVYYPWILKINEEGDVLWQKILNNDGDYVTSIRAISSNIYIAAGFNKRTNKYWIVKMNEKGKILLKKIYGSRPSNYDFRNDPPKSFILPSSSGGFLLLTDHGNIWKLNNDGNAQWKKYIYSIGDFSFCDVYLSSANEFKDGYLLLGKAVCWTDRGGTPFIFIIKIDKNGEPIWSRNIILPENMYIEDTMPNDILTYQDGTSLSVIEIRPIEEGNNITYSLKKILVIKINKLGQVEWQKIISPQIDLHLSGLNIIKNNSNSNDVTLSASTSDSFQYGFVIELNPSGEINIVKSYSGYKTVILPTKNGYYIIGSTSLYSNNLSDVWVLKVNNDYDIPGECSLINDSSLMINEANIYNYLTDYLDFYKLYYLKPQEVPISSKDTYSKAITKCSFETNVENPPSASFSFYCSPKSLPFLLRISKCYFYAGENFKGKVYLSCENLPQGASCSFTPSQIELNAKKAETLLNIKITSSLKSGTYLFHVVAKSGSLEKKFPMEFKVISSD